MGTNQREQTAFQKSHNAQAKQHRRWQVRDHRAAELTRFCFSIKHSKIAARTLGGPEEERAVYLLDLRIIRYQLVLERFHALNSIAGSRQPLTKLVASNLPFWPRVNNETTHATAKNTRYGTISCSTQGFSWCP